MAKFIQIAQQAFDLIETGKGWDKVKEFCVPEAFFKCDVLPISALSDYSNWMTGMCETTAPDSQYELISVTSNETQVVFCARFHATHTGKGGPVEPSQPPKATNCHYVYIMDLNESGKIIGITKIWDQLTAFLQFGWPLPEKPQFVLEKKQI